MVYISSQNLFLILGGKDDFPSICFFRTTEALRSLELGLARVKRIGMSTIFYGIPGIKNSDLPYGKHTKSYWTWPFIVSFPIKHGDFP